MQIKMIRSEREHKKNCQRTMVENMMRFDLRLTHISGTKNAIANCPSRLTRRIREAQHVPLADPILADYAVVKKLNGYKDQIETVDPWVQRLATAVMEDTDYITCPGTASWRTWLNS